MKETVADQFCSFPNEDVSNLIYVSWRSSGGHTLTGIFGACILESGRRADKEVLCAVAEIRKQPVSPKQDDFFTSGLYGAVRIVDDFSNEIECLQKGVTIVSCPPCAPHLRRTVSWSACKWRGIGPRSPSGFCARHERMQCFYSPSTGGREYVHCTIQNTASTLPLLPLKRQTGRCKAPLSTLPIICLHQAQPIHVCIGNQLVEVNASFDGRHWSTLRWSKRVVALDTALVHPHCVSSKSELRILLDAFCQLLLHAKTCTLAR